MSAFTKLDEQTCYWLGVLFADGSGTRYNRIIFKSKDYSFIKAFADYVGQEVIEGKGARSTVYRVDFSDRELRQRLIELGFTKERKSERKLPKLILENPEIARHFMRGYFDGDGSIHKDHRKLNGWRLEISTHRPYSSDMRSLINASCPNANVRLYPNRKSERLMIYNFEGVKEVLRWLYKDASVCPHPKVKADSVKSLIEEIL